MKQARDRLTYVDGRLRLWDDRRAQLAGLEDDPRGRFHLINARQLVRMFGALRRVLTIEVASHQANLDAIGPDGFPDPLALKSPDDDPGYHAARREVDHALATFLWRMQGEGIDLVLRAAGVGQAIEPLDDTEAAAREARAAELRDEMAEDETLASVVTSLATDLADTVALLGWGTEAFKKIERLEGGARRALLGAGEWARLGRKVALLERLHDRTMAFPALVKWFRAADPVTLPYPDATEWAPAATAADQVQLGQRGKASSLRLDGPTRRPGA